MNVKCKGIIFDVDGTLAETEELHRAAFNSTFKKNFIDWFWSPEIYRELLNISGGKERLMHYEHLQSGEIKAKNKYVLMRLHAQKTKAYARSLYKTKIKARPGVIKLIEQAKAKKIKLGIATATSLTNVESLVENIWGTPLYETFGAVATSDEVSLKKPSPEVYKLVLKKLRLEPKHCIAIEDSLIGLQSAVDAGLKTIITPSFYTKNEDFSSADLVLPSLVEIDLSKTNCQAAIN